MSEKPVVRLEVDGDVGIIVIDYPPVNALGPGVREGIVEAVDKAEADPKIKAMVMIGAGRSFIAGADIRQFGKPRPTPARSSYEVLDQTKKPGLPNGFHSLGNFRFNAGEEAAVIFRTEGAKGTVHIDCVQVLPAR